MLSLSRWDVIVTAFPSAMVLLSFGSFRRVHTATLRLGVFRVSKRWSNDMGSASVKTSRLSTRAFSLMWASIFGTLFSVLFSSLWGLFVEFCREGAMGVAGKLLLCLRFLYSLGGGGRGFGRGMGCCVTGALRGAPGGFYGVGG